MQHALDRQTLGKCGEDAACAELARRGYAILARRYRTRFGEIDIVSRDGDTIVFVEVKARRTTRRGAAAEQISFWKRRRITAMALDYLSSARLLDRRCRFDVVAIDEAGSVRPRVRVIVNAFQPAEWGQWG
ncbi:MAG TPA: YraN family protein [Vicinamibacterales bacterium]|jgi:putative endonuclease|nr:YraN family protein [Vicinamibacterales bacterium]